MLIVFILCTLVPLLLVDGAVIRDKRQYQLHQTKFIDELDGARREMARQGNHSNVWKVEWSQELVDKAYSRQQADHDCLALIPAYNYRFFFHDGNQDAVEYERGWMEWFARTIPEDKKKAMEALDGLLERTAYFYEKMNPLQSKVGCIPWKCEFPIDALNLEYKYVCFIGPYGQFPRDEVNGPPGSQCGASGHNENGLCVEN